MGGYESAKRLQANVMGSLYAHVLARLSIGVVACDERLEVIEANAEGRRLLDRLDGNDEDPQALPDSIRIAAENWFAADAIDQRPCRIESPGGAFALYASFMRPNVSPIHLAITLRREVMRDDVLLSALRDRFNISTRQYRLIELVRQGCSNREISRSLGLTYATVKNYMHKLFAHLGVHSRTELLALVDRVRRGE